MKKSHEEVLEEYRGEPLRHMKKGASKGLTGAAGLAGAGVGAAGGAAAGKGASGLAGLLSGLGGGAGKSKLDTKEFEVPTEENMRPYRPRATREGGPSMKKGGMVSASKRADGCAIRGKTKGRMV